MQAYPYRLPIWASPEQLMQVTIDIFQQDIYRIFESASSNHVTQESLDEAFHRTRMVELVPYHIIWSAGWEDEIARLLTTLDLEQENYRQAMQALPGFVRERAREALWRGFNGLTVVCTVENVHTFVVEEQLTGTVDDDGERWFLAAMADGKVRSLLCKNKDASCPICLDGFLDGSSEMYELRCSHAYHPHCIRCWFDQCRRLRQQVRCPVCRDLL